MSEVSTEEAKVEAPKAPTLQELILQLGGPDAAQIDLWKQKHGDVLVSAFSETEIFIIRALLRHEYRALQLKLTDPALKMDQFDYEEAVAKTCTLWPDPNTNPAALQKGGTATTLAEQIMQNSNFFNPQQAATLVMKL